MPPMQMAPKYRGPAVHPVASLALLLGGVASCAASRLRLAAAHGARAAAENAPLTPGSTLYGLGQHPDDLAAAQASASVAMRSTDPMFARAAGGDAGLALTVAARLGQLTGVPMARFKLLLPAEGAAGTSPPNASNASTLGSPAVECGAPAQDSQASRYASSDNTSFACADAVGLHSFAASAAGTSTAWEAVVLPPTGVDGDAAYAGKVAAAVSSAARRPSALFRLLFPGTYAALPGEALPLPRNQSLPLGLNPGGHHHGPAGENATDNAWYLVTEADDINARDLAELRDLAQGLSRASDAHLGVLNFNPYEPAPAQVSGVLPLAPGADLSATSQRYAAAAGAAGFG